MHRGPTHATLAVTARCNSRCAMCDIWRAQPAEEAEPSLYFRLPSTLTNVNITGGEPFLRDDLVQIVCAVSERLPRARIVISTNGLAEQRILRLTREMLEFAPHVALRVSLDGRAAAHERLRGVPGAHDRALRTLEGLRRLGVHDLGLAFTLARGNETELLWVFELCRTLGVQFSLSMVHSSPHFFGDQRDWSPDPELALLGLERLLRRQLHSLDPRSWARAYFTQGLIDVLCGRGRPLPCGALIDLFHLDPAGRVFPCNLLDEPLGALADAEYAELLQRSPDALEAARRCRIPCWMVCTAAPAMRRRPSAMLWWALRAELGLGRARAGGDR